MATKTTKTAPKTETVELPRCLCGCGAVRNPKRFFVQGHDMVLRSRLLAEFDGGSTEAADELVARGWYSASELGNRREKREAKEARKAKAVADREAKKATKVVELAEAAD